MCPRCVMQTLTQAAPFIGAAGAGLILARHSIAHLFRTVRLRFTSGSPSESHVD